MNTYFDNHFQKKVITIYPGEFYSTTGTEMISTVLGSCVSVALFDEERKIGGINHFMLAKNNTPDETKETIALPGKYGEYAIDLLIKDLVSKGTDITRLNAKVFGGSNIFNQENAQVGEVNAKFAFEYLKRKGIPVLKHDTGGNYPRKIFFDPVNSKVYMKYIQNSHLESKEVEEREKSLFSGVDLKKVENLFPDD